jgi:exopolysaccharide biosynthesis polyprenyl glycosylphosphotransferase
VNPDLDRSNPRDPFWFPLLILVFADGVTFFGSVMLAYVIRFSVIDPLLQHLPWLARVFTEGTPVFGEFAKLGLYATVFGLFVFQRFGLYARRIGMKRKAHAWSIVTALIVSYVFVTAWLFVYVNWRYDYSRSVVALSLVLSIGGSIAVHFLLRNLQGLMIRRGLGFERTVLVTTPEDLSGVTQRLRAWHGSQYHVIGCVFPGGAIGGTEGGVPVLADIEEIERVLGREEVDRVVVALPPKYHLEALNLFRTCRERGIKTQVAPALFEAITGRISVGEAEGIPTISLGETPLTGTYAIVKSLSDMVMAGMLLILSLPVMAVVSIVIKLESRGSVIYRQERIGVGGRLFTLLKFRTMKEGAEEETGPVFARENDPRCTRVGSFLRRYNLDELPQFLNVLKGEMAVVGPRPERPYFVNRFKQEIPGYMRRHVVKPGMTGWAQIHGLRGNTSVEDRTRYDIYYVENWSLNLDVKILLRTLSTGRNAY